VLEGGAVGRSVDGEFEIVLVAEYVACGSELSSGWSAVVA
jgi:hypothetical protein